MLCFDGPYGVSSPRDQRAGKEQDIEEVFAKEEEACMMIRVWGLQDARCGEPSQPRFTSHPTLRELAHLILLLIISATLQLIQTATGPTAMCSWSRIGLAAARCPKSTAEARTSPRHPLIHIGSTGACTASHTLHDISHNQSSRRTSGIPQNNKLVSYFIEELHPGEMAADMAHPSPDGASGEPL